MLYQIFKMTISAILLIVWFILTVALALVSIITIFPALAILFFSRNCFPLADPSIGITCFWGMGSSRKNFWRGKKFQQKTII